MKNGSDSLAHLLAAPDLDADGTRDLIVVSRFSGREPNNQIFREPEPARVYVDALSGKDGRELWSWRGEALNGGDHAHLVPLLVGPRFGRLADAGTPGRRPPGPWPRPGGSVSPPRSAGRPSPRSRDRPNEHMSSTAFPGPSRPMSTATASSICGAPLTTSFACSAPSRRIVACSRRAQASG